MRLEITGDDFSKPHIIRSAAYFLLHAIGDIKDEDVPTGTTLTTTAAQTTPTAAEISLAVGSSPISSSIPTPPPLPDNVVNFPVPPPPAPVASAGNPVTIIPIAPSPPVTTADTFTASAEYDSAGMPWDERIHQRGKAKKRDGTWKLQKLYNSTPEKEAAFAMLIQSVTLEHAARKSGAAPPVASPVSLPAGGNSVPMPPVSAATSATAVPPPPASASVSVPPPPAVGPMGGSPYRALIDKIADLTRQQKISASKVMELCQRHGAPNLMQLNNMQHLVPLVDRDLDAAVLGVL